jgi:hypothetical protein
MLRRWIQRQTDRHDEAYRKSVNAPKNWTLTKTSTEGEKHLNQSCLKLPNKMLENGKIPSKLRTISTADASEIRLITP